MRGAIVIAVLTAALALSIAVSHAETSNPNTIRVETVGLHSSNGVLNCALFSSADGFPDDSSKALKTVKTGIENGKAVCAFQDVGAGDYGVAVYHDENSNGKLDRNFIGMPKEGVGASNDASGHLGPPKFEDARFTYSGGTKLLTIHIRYLTAPL